MDYLGKNVHILVSVWDRDVFNADDLIGASAISVGDILRGIQREGDGEGEMAEELVEGVDIDVVDKEVEVGIERMKAGHTLKEKEGSSEDGVYHFEVPLCSNGSVTGYFQVGG